MIDGIKNKTNKFFPFSGGNMSKRSTRGIEESDGEMAPPAAFARARRTRGTHVDSDGAADRADGEVEIVLPPNNRTPRPVDSHSGSTLTRRSNRGHAAPDVSSRLVCGVTLHHVPVHVNGARGERKLRKEGWANATAISACH